MRVLASVFRSSLVVVCVTATTACAPPERDHKPVPWGGIPLDGLDDDGGMSSSGDHEPGSDDGEPPPDDDDGPPPLDDDGGSTGGEEDEEPPGSPYVGGWDIGNCQDDIVASGTGIGQIAPDFVLTDQFGDQVRLYDFCHEAVYLVAGAFW